MMARTNRQCLVPRALFLAAVLALSVLGGDAAQSFTTTLSRLTVTPDSGSVAGDTITLSGTLACSDDTAQEVACPKEGLTVSCADDETPHVSGTGGIDSNNAFTVHIPNVISGSRTFSCWVPEHTTHIGTYSASKNSLKRVLAEGGTSTPTLAPTKAPTKQPTKAPTKAPTEAPTTKPTAKPTPSSCSNPAQYRAPGGCRNCVSRTSPFFRTLGGYRCVNPTTLSSASTVCTGLVLPVFIQDANFKTISCINADNPEVRLLLVTQSSSAGDWFNASSYNKKSFRLGGSIPPQRDSTGQVKFVADGSRRKVFFQDRFGVLRKQRGRTVQLTGVLNRGGTLLDQCFVGYVRVC